MMNQLVTIDPTRFASVTAGSAASDVSARYTFIPTVRVLDVFRDLGWFPVNIQEKAVRLESRRGFQKHVVRLRHSDFNAVQNVGGLIPEILLLNSHDRSTVFQIMAGIFRLVCANGLIISDSMFATHRVKHIGYSDDKIAVAIADAQESIPRIMGRVGEFQEIELTPNEQGVFARAASALRWDDGKGPDETTLLRVDRADDRDPSLWNIYNRIQEKMIDGKRSARRGQTIRKIKGVDSNVRLNRALWTLTEQMALLKSGEPSAVPSVN